MTTSLKNLNKPQISKTEQLWDVIKNTVSQFSKTHTHTHFYFGQNIFPENRPKHVVQEVINHEGRKETEKNCRIHKKENEGEDCPEGFAFAFLSQRGKLFQDEGKMEVPLSILLDMLPC